MMRIYLSTLLLLLAGMALIAPSAGQGFECRSTIAAGASDPPNLTAFQLFFKRQPVDQMVIGDKIKKYSINLSGTAFAAGSNAVVDSLGVCALGLGQPQTLTTIDQDSTHLRAAFPRSTELSSGLLSVKVVGPDGSGSNMLAIDVIAKPAELSVSSISPQSGPIGTPVTLAGVGFSRGDPIRFSAVGSDRFELVGLYSRSSADGATLSFQVPDSVIIPVCAICTGLPVCDPAATLSVSPGQYQVSVINSKGMSNVLLFEVTAR